MRLRTLMGRIGLPVVLVSLATAGAGLPSSADPGDDPDFPDFPDYPMVELVVPDRVVAIDGRSKTIDFDVENFGDETASGLVLTFGNAARPMPASVGLTPPAGCTVAGCELGDLKAGQRKTLSVTFKPTTDLPTFGATFELGLRDATRTWEHGAELTVARTGSGVDLELAAIENLELDPGGSAGVPIAFTNSGNKAPAGYGLVLIGDPFIDFPMNYSNCFPIDEEAEEDSVYSSGVACAFAEPIEPGETVTLAGKTPVKVHVAAEAPGPDDYFAGAYVVGLTEKDLAELPAGVKDAGAASALKVKPVEARATIQGLDIDPTELNEWDNGRTFTVAVSRNPADVVALGGTFEGAAGDSRTVEIGLRNDGPAATRSPFQGWLQLAEITMPTGVEVTKVDPACVAVEGRSYLCLQMESLRKGEKAVFSFTGTIESAGKPGSIKVDNGDHDPRKGNDKAAIAVKLSTAGSGAGAGADDDDPSLPVTGAPAGLIAAGGAVLLAGGVVSLAYARRRRIVTVVD